MPGPGVVHLLCAADPWALGTLMGPVSELGFKHAETEATGLQRSPVNGILTEKPERLLWQPY